MFPRGITLKVRRTLRSHSLPNSATINALNAELPIPWSNACKNTLGKKLRFVFRNFPADGSASVCAGCGTEAAEAAALQKGKFWEMHDMIYENQDELEPRILVAWAEKLGLDVHAFRSGHQAERYYKTDQRRSFERNSQRGKRHTELFHQWRKIRRAGRL